jgi:hypothetical protein
MRIRYPPRFVDTRPTAGFPFVFDSERWVGYGLVLWTAGSPDRAWRLGVHVYCQIVSSSDAGLQVQKMLFNKLFFS